MEKSYVTKRGVYKDLTLSPYEYESPYGDLFKFSSQKKLEMYARDIEKEIQRLDKLLMRNDLYKFIPPDNIQNLYKGVFRSFYCKIEV